MPALYLEERVGRQDRRLRDRLYDGLLGRYYQQLMPFLTLPVRPWRQSWRAWVAYGLIVGSIAAAAVSLVALAVGPGPINPQPGHFLAAVWLALAAAFFYLHPYFFYLMALAVPVRISTLRHPYRPDRTFREVHEEMLGELHARQGLTILDVCSGTGNSLYRHGWLDLDARFVALDLSETMLRQAKQRKPTGKSIEFVLGDSADLPFQSDAFDVVLNYGAVNGVTDPGRCIAEMARVTRPGGLILLYDEQLYPAASNAEGLYFRRVLSSHNTVHRFPADLLPSILRHVEVHQVYQFYYLCLARKDGASPYDPGTAHGS